MRWQCAQHCFTGEMPVIMGILNMTPDSFSDGGRFACVEEARAAGIALVQQGARIIDVGGESTRPGAVAVSAQEELSRVIELVRALCEDPVVREAGACVSIDTRHAEVARACVAVGAAIINDVSGFCDPDMIALARSCDAGLIVVHGYEKHVAREAVSAAVRAISGSPADAQTPGAANVAGADGAGNADGAKGDVVDEAYRWLRDKTIALVAAGIDPARICVDPGPGFGKTDAETLLLARNLHEFRHLGYPVMAALSRKSYIGMAYNIDDPVQRDTASAAEVLLACELGANIVRVHNVELTAAALKDLRPYCLLGLGCNVALIGAGHTDGSPDTPEELREAKIAQLNMAIGDLCLLPDTQVIDIAPFYESEPAYYTDQDVFVNTVVLLRTGIAPKELLDYLHAIENKLGRVRTIENGPRTCDIDILDYQTYVVNSAVLTLPHPRVTERDFVVRPLSDILPHHVLADGTPVERFPAPERIGRAVRVTAR